MSSPLLKATQVPTITAGAYAAGDAIGGLLTFAGITDFNPQFSDDFTVLISKLIITDKTSHAPPELMLVLFDDLFTPTADNSPFPTTNPSLAVIAANYQGHILIDANKWLDLNACAVACVQPNLPVKTVAGSVYGQLVAVGAPTFGAVNDLSISMVGEYLFK